MKIRSFITLNSSQNALQYLCLVYITCNIILTEQIPHYIDNNNIDRNNECMVFFNLQKLILKNQALCILIAKMYMDIKRKIVSLKK